MTELLKKEDAHFLAEELLRIKKQVIETEYPEMPFANGDILPISTELPEGTKYYEYKIYNKLGMAKIIANPADDLPRTDIEVKKVAGKIVEIGNQFGYSFKDIRSASLTGTPLKSDLQMNAKEQAYRKFDELIQYGDAAHNIVGLYNNSNITEYAVSTVGTGSPNTAWLVSGVATKTADQIIADINGFVNSIYINSKKTKRANLVLLPLLHYTYIASTPRSATSDKTILDWVVSVNPGVKFMEVNGLDKNTLTSYGILGPTGAALTGSMMMALTVNPQTAEINMPMNFKMQPEYQLGLEMLTPCEMEIGGADVKMPLGFAYAKNI